MWQKLYDSFLQFMTVSWADFLRMNRSAGRAVKDSFQYKVYPEVGLSLLVIGGMFAFFYYYYLNARFGRYYSVKSWLVMLFISSIVVGVVTYLRTKSILDGPSIDVSQQLLSLSLINTIYAAFLFLLMSLIIKWYSPMGKRTPF